ncbi:MAG: FAD-dependent oxidoreductase [Bacteroidia bacterium]|nr:FAD-dependent oxidoreductase [Bacteroidia bacterium]
MKAPIIFFIDDDPQVLQAVRRDLRRKYKPEYQVFSSISANEALEALLELKKQQETVALFLSDQRMPEMLGVEFLEKAKKIYPEAKRVLLTAYSDIDAAIKAINDVQLDFYLTKPWDPPEEKLFPVLDDLLDAWQGSHTPEYTGLRVVGYQWSPKSHQVKDFLSGNLHPYQWLDIQTEDKAKELLALHNIPEKDLPALFFEDGTFLANATIPELGRKIGKSTETKEDLYDVAIIGAGPSGLSAGVYGGSEGLKTLLIEKRAPGGQAGTSSRIENYLGFPSGLSGADLARRAITQATRFGVELLSPAEVSRIDLQGPYKILTLADGSKVKSKALVITTGVDYRRLPAKGADDFTGAGVYYGAATTEAYACKDKDVFIVGGGNSAGQGAMYLSNYARKVFIVIRREDLSSTMSQYLIDQISATDNIELLPFTEIAEAHGVGQLQQLTLLDCRDGSTRQVEAGALFIFIGAKPYTDWLGIPLYRNDKGYILTGRDVMSCEGFDKVWKESRDPYLLETCVPGVFAAGDVRAGAMNRVASAVGEGAMSISFVHQYLAGF